MRLAATTARLGQLAAFITGRLMAAPRLHVAGSTVVWAEQQCTSPSPQLTGHTPQPVLHAKRLSLLILHVHRWMGGTRFVVGALQQILLKRKHAARVALLEPGAESAGSSSSSAAAAAASPAAADGLQSTAQPPAIAAAQQQAEALAAAAAQPGPPVQQLAAFQQLAGEGWGGGRTEGWSLALIAQPGAWRSLRAVWKTATERIQQPALRNKPHPVPPLPPAARQLPPGWQWLPEPEVALFTATNLPRLDMNFHLAPDATPDSGKLAGFGGNDSLTGPQGMPAACPSCTAAESPTCRGVAPYTPTHPPTPCTQATSTSSTLHPPAGGRALSC